MFRISSHSRRGKEIMGDKDALFNLNRKIDSLKCDKELINIKLTKLKAEIIRIKYDVKRDK